jgi:myxalamid-type polyketide synthase MxaE and MxaD
MTQSDQLSPLKQAFLAIEKLQNKLDQMQQAQTEPIAIIGMGCRFPHGANSPQAFWEALRAGRDGVTEIPPERWDADAYFDPDPQKAGKISTRWGGFLDNVTNFDARFFGISPREAAQMDPQQRLVLEVAWEALEAAGQPPDRLAGSLTGVYLGLLNSEYGWLQLQDVAGMDAYSGTGTSHSVASGRLSYFLGLQGPSVTLDTACSSSLVAIHMACQALRAGECHLALAGGVSVMLSPLSLMPFARMGLLAKDGRCKTLDARADGFVGGEGCGIVVLKRLSAAQADGDPILALIRGSAVNQDGRTNVLSAPNGLAQAAVIRQALANARLEPRDISFIEMHGTGTVYGDPIEVDALRDVFGGRPEGGQSCPLGAVKSSIGHTAAAAGVAGVVKTVLALQNETIPPNLHFQELNPHISLDGAPFTVPVKAQPWPVGERPRCAGISSFGWSGTNAHLILSEPPPLKPVVAASQPAYLLPLSARDPQALRQLAAAYRDHLQETAFSGSQSVADIVYTAAVRRTHHPRRTAVVGRSHYQLAEQLKHFLDESAKASDSPPLPLSPSPSLPFSPSPKLAFVFSPHGSQWPGMGRRLWSQSAVFRDAINRVQAAMSGYIDWSVADKFAQAGDDGWLEQIDVLQPTLFALQVALAEMWRAWGVEPEAIVGHSMGELAAAHVAGVLSLDEAARIICRRTQLLSRVRGEGAMGVVELSYQEAQAAIAPFNGRLHVAVSNSPRSTVVGGDPDALEALFDELLEREIFCGWGVADVASHSPKMDNLRPELLQAIGELNPSPAQIPLYSTVTGALADGRQLDRDYWARHLNQPVLFADALRALAERGHTLFLEISPGPVLAPAIEEGLRALGREGATLSTLRRDANEYEAMLDSLGRLYALGYPVQWAKIAPPGETVALPTYLWQRERFWLSAHTASRSLARHSLARHSLARHSLAHAANILGQRREMAHDSRRELWENELDRRLHPSLFDCRLFDTVVLPTAAYLEMLLQAINRSQFTVRDLQFPTPLPLAEEAPWTEIQLLLEDQPGNTAVFRCYGRHGENWTKQAYGRIEPIAPDPDTAVSLAELTEQCRETITADVFYQQLAATGLAYGPGLQPLAEIGRGDRQVVARLRLDENGAQMGLSTAVLESAFQLLSWAALPDENGNPFTVSAIDGVTWRPSGALPESVYINWRLVNEDTVVGDALLLDGNGAPILTLRGVRLERLAQTTTSASSVQAVPHPADWLYETLWQPAPLPPETPTAPGRWLIFADSQGIGAALADQLRAEGHEVVLVTAGERPEDFEALLTAVLTAPCQGIIYLWGLDTPQNDLPDLTQVVAPALRLAQMVKQLRPDGAYPLWLVTQGAQPVTGTPVSVAQSPLWGLGVVLAEEQHELWGGLVDLDPASPPEQNAAQLKSQMLYGRHEDRVAFHEGRRYTARLSPRRLSLSKPDSPWRADAAYLITGGLGEIALELAPWAVAQGARRLILLGRSPLPPRADWSQLDPASQTGRRTQAIRALEAMGAAVHYAAVDVSDKSQLYEFLDNYAAEGWPPIRGIIHAAAVIEDKLLPELDEASLRRVLAAKAQGAWLLHRYFDETRPLDFFLLFSSIAAIMGNAGQASYAAANAFLDALAHLRRSQGQPALSLNWGLWGELGFAVTTGGQRVVDYMRGFGLTPLTTPQALDGFELLLAQPELTQTAVLRADWRRWAKQGRLVGLSPFLQTVCRVDEQGERRQPALTIRDRLEAVPAGPSRVQTFQTFLRDQLADVLKIDPVHIDRETPLGDLGIDSFTAIELRNRLERSLSVTLSATVAWNYPTIAAMTPYLAGKMGLPLAPEAAHATPDLDDDIAALLSQASDLSAEELEAFLNEGLTD